MIIAPTVPQDKFIFSQAKYPAFVGGFGSGKTEALILRSIINKIANPGTNRAFYEPTYDLIRMIAWPRFEEILSTFDVPYRLLKSPLNVLKIEGYGDIIFRSMDTPARIIGYEVADSDVDELDTLKKDDAADVWRRILSRNRQKKESGENTVAVATTPEGFRFVYSRWEETPLEGHEIVRAPSYSNPYLPEGYVDDLRRQYPEHLIQAYIEGHFVNMTSGQVYVSFDRVQNGTNDIEKTGEPLFIGMDFNVGNMSAVVHVKRGGNPIAVGEIYGAYDTPDMIRLIRARFSDHPAIIYPDASGDSRKSVDASKTDISLLKEAGFRVTAPKKNPKVRDRINCMNAAFSQEYRVNVDKCPNYVRCLEQQAYAQNGEPDKTQGLDHLPDAAGYFIHNDYPIIKPAMSINIGMAY